MLRLFDGWRRKAGYVTLTIACLFAAGWIRSLTATDIVYFTPSQRPTSDFVLSLDGVFCWKHSNDAPYAIPSNPHLISQAHIPMDKLWSTHDTNLVKSWGLEIGTGIDNEDSIVVAYAWIVIPMTLLSVYMLLSKPRNQLPLP